MMCTKLIWDSEFFGINIATFDFDNKTQKAIKNSEEFDMIVVKNNLENKLSLPNFKQTFQETKVVFSKILHLEANLNINNFVFDTDSSSIETSDLYDLAFESGKHSRFKLDSNFQEAKFFELYQKWVDNSLNKQFADKVFYIKENNLIKGFVTIKLHSKYATIGLIGIDNKSQGKGFGSLLIKKSEQYCLQNNILELQIPTQKENYLACKFYSKLDYTILNEINYKHLWKI